jgi:DNA-binding NtrC family response regulator
MTKNRHVFVVDDEAVIASTLAAMLRVSGFSATWFTDPMDALHAAYLYAPDLLLSDVVMPGLSGVDLAVQIQTLCPECKVLLFSGQANTVDFQKDAQRVCSTFHILPKPINPGDLLRAIREQGLQN